MSRKTTLPDIDTTALRELAQQFPGAAGQATQAQAQPAIAAAAAQAAPVPGSAPEPSQEPDPALARETPPDPEPAAPAARSWQDSPLLRFFAVGAVALAIGYAAGTARLREVDLPAPAAPAAPPAPVAADPRAQPPGDAARIAATLLAIPEAGIVADGALAAARSVFGADPAIALALDRLARAAAGVPERIGLVAQFDLLRAEAQFQLQSAKPTTRAGQWLAQTASFFGSREAQRLAADTATLEAARQFLAVDDLPAAALAVGRLETSVRGLFSPWLAAAQARLAVDTEAARAAAVLLATARRGAP
jgi:hypothetical protein